ALTPFTTSIQSIEAGNITLFEKSVLREASVSDKPLLIGKCQAQIALDTIMAGVYAANDLTTAMEWRQTLQSHESIITRDGIWLGQNWLRVFRDQDTKRGVLQREQELADIQLQVAALDDEISQLEDNLDATQQKWNALEQQRASIQQQ